jgi:hypothetical protein
LDAAIVGKVRYFPAVVQRGFVLDGLSGYLEAPDNSGLHSITTGVTVAAWINPQVPTPVSGPGYMEGNILSRRDPMVSDGISLFVNSDGALGFQFTAAGGSGVSAAWPPNLFDGTWRHVAMTADTQTGLVTFYYNGAQIMVDAPTGLSGTFADVNHLFIGHRQRMKRPKGRTAPARSREWSTKFNFSTVP